ncbi:dihydrofolate reductase [Paenibacillus chondroitinus]|uniref:Dihydrofolate reductase n=1 Tax=Paenibacillus chondroitinus TaxID=59842 RepID=A0ABU6D7K5_9BACL|nr:dihydrofolate reductase [Paenibacillus chondroitinus]MCY9661636.1 dihydrofolate reductase [Paenibacillus anseongense]MEB4793721.1 dihydrofolate reductase [Paenibacillus chondroitinus]
MEIYLIAAMDKNRVIGKDNDIPWRIPNDWRYVNQITKGHTIVLGRRNFESIGKVLPDRRNIILSRDTELSIEGCEMAHSIQEVFDLCQNEEKIFIFGGEQIYKLFMPYVKKMYVTKIHHEFEGDTYFPEIDFSEWKEVSVEKGITDSKNPYTYFFHIYDRN